MLTRSLTHICGTRGKWVKCGLRVLYLLWPRQSWYERWNECDSNHKTFFATVHNTYLTSEAYAFVCWVAIGSVNGLSLFLCDLLLIQILPFKKMPLRLQIQPLKSPSMGINIDLYNTMVRKLQIIPDIDSLVQDCSISSALAVGIWFMVSWTNYCIRNSPLIQMIAFG